MKKSLLTVPLQYKRASDISKIIKKLPEEVEAYEVWIDQFMKTDLKASVISSAVQEWLELSKKKLIVVCKDPEEHGGFSGSTSQKLKLLQAAAAAGAHYVDLGFHSGAKALETLKKGKKKSKLIISHHDFEKTPDIQTLEKLAEKMGHFKPDVLKLATMVHEPEDTERLMELAVKLKEEKQKHIILGMGQLGVTTRIFSDQIGNEFNFVTLESKTAPGQLSLEQALQFRSVIE
jgi:3-dehydroquinate dehydratase-1